MKAPAAGEIEYVLADQRTQFADTISVALEVRAEKDQEYTIGIVGVAVPILSSDGRALGALALHGPEPRFSLDTAKQQVQRLKTAAKALATVWGLSGNYEVSDMQAQLQGRSER